MAKKVTTLYLDTEVCEHAKEFKINLSEFVNTEYRNKFLSLAAKEAELAKKRDEILVLEQEVLSIRERMEGLMVALTESEKRFVSTVMPRLRDGKELSAMHRAFNADFSRSFSLHEFEQLVRVYERQAEKRLSYVINQKRRKV